MIVLVIEQDFEIFRIIRNYKLFIDLGVNKNLHYPTNKITKILTQLGIIRHFLFD